MPALVMAESASASWVEIAPATQPLPAALPKWSLTARIVFRFVCAYWVLYSLPSAGRVSFLGIVPGAQYYHRLWHAIVPWVAIHIFKLSGSVTVYRPTGSGDTSLDYVHTLCLLALAAAIAAVWSVLDWKRGEYRTLHAWLRLLMRYTLAITLFSYGFAKVFPLQFPYPALNRFIEPFGDFSPMGVLWSFMGSSPAYTMFAGAAEVAGGALLLFPRTTLLGSMVSAATMLNIVVLNFCYDVPVKLYSSHLLLMAVFLMAPDLGKLASFLVMNGPAVPVSASGPAFERRWTKIGALAFKTLLIGFFLFENITGGYRGYQRAVVHPARPPLYGLYRVESFTRNGKEVPPLITDSSVWKMVVAPNLAVLQVKMMDDSVKGFGATYGPADGTVTLAAGANSAFTYLRPDADHVVMTGSLGSGALVVTVRKIDPSTYLLVNRGFHWISELPFNR
jgi:uncharacterized membrane protein YphA (DoxX/SURF4 family)